ncbi:MAG: hypothetical protein WBO36_10365 [Saprospiraceae bacterium]
MIFIPEDIINTTIEKYADEQVFISGLASIANDQLDLYNYIDQENHSLLTEDECSLLAYLTVIIYHSTQTILSKPLQIKGTHLEKAEEDNWDIFNQSKTKNFTQILDLFFKGYEQEDLLALVEDSIVHDQELDDVKLVTPVGKEIIFVVCKSIIDCLHTNN